VKRLHILLKLEEHIGIRQVSFANLLHKILISSSNAHFNITVGIMTELE